MSAMIERLKGLSHKQLLLLALDQQEQIDTARKRDHEPIAVVGIGCRMPGGGNDPQAFWSVLHEGHDAIREVPADRWDIDMLFHADPDMPGRMSVRNGGFLEDVAGFDAAFFGISPREALTMDPQQRLLLEVTWEALEHAGIAPDGLAESDTGVFVGICNSDYFQRLLQRGRDQIDPYLASGNAYSVAAGRIAYCLGLQGPAIAVDTSCSASLVALHLACQSLRRGETSLALCGGVNVICSPETNIALSKAHMLAPDGRCKTFDDSADGYARGEGCGVVVLRRLSDATARNERVLGVVLGTATNQDGRSGGLTVPNGRAQEAVIRAALADAGVDPGVIDYVEAHGTGTSLGDPIEVRAIAAALGAGRTLQQTVTIGSVKTNIGHLESAAGIAGLIKVLLSLANEQIPPNPHLHVPNGHIEWPDYPVALSPQGKPWPAGERRRIAGVSSFGFSGTNAHAIVAETPPLQSIEPQEHRPAHLLPLSARSGSALTELARRYADVIEADPGLALPDITYTAGVGRSHLAERAGVLAADRDQMLAALRSLAAGTVHPAIRRGTVVGGKAPEVVFVFTGQGAQHPGMSRGLYATAPVFRDVIDRADKLLGPDQQGRTLKSVLWEENDGEQPIHDTTWTQPALFAVEYGLAQLWGSWGVAPAAVIGHSVGEYAAACVAGVFSFEDGLRLIAERGRLMGSLPPGGKMAAVFAPEPIVQEVLASVACRVAIAAVNGPENVVISGEAAGVAAVLTAMTERGIRGQELFISFAAHSPLVEPAQDAMEACARAVPMHAPTIPVAWNLTGGRPLPGGAAPDAAYWRRHLREPVRFADGMKSLHDAGWRCFLEIGPHPTLTALARQSLPEQGTRFFWSLRRERSDWQEMLRNLADLYAIGAPIDWEAVEKPYGGRRVTLPTYPFEHRRFWVTPPQHDQPTMAANDEAADDTLFYEVAWEPVAAIVGAAQSLRAPSEFAPGLRARFDAVADRHGIAVYDALLPELDRLSLHYVIAALNELGFNWSRGRSFFVHDEAARMGVAERHQRLFARILGMLVEEGALRDHGGRLEVIADIALCTPDHAELLARFAATDSELCILARCGKSLARVLTGEQDPLALLFPGGSLAEAGRLYRESPFALTYNGTIAEAVAAAIDALSPAARLRILEIGAGTGGTTAPLLPTLPADRVEYTFTDLSPLFLQEAGERFASYPFLRRALLDIEQDPAAQGFAPGGYDVVLAANVLHATDDLQRVIQHIRSLLAPGGLLLLLEGTVPERWVDLTFGLTEGWWRFRDTALRPEHPLIDRQAWTCLLSDLGFSDIVAIPDGIPASRSRTQQALIIARVPARGQLWTLVGEPEGVAGALAATLRARGDVVKLVPIDAEPAATEGTLVYLGAIGLADRASDDASAVEECKLRACDKPLGWLADAARGWLVTRGAQPVQGRVSTGARWQAPLWGIGRVFALERPQQFAGLLDLPPDGSDEQLARILVAALDACDGEDQTAWRDGERFAPRLLPAARPRSRNITFRPDATYLVSGGFGGIGLLVARWMAEHGARHIALLGRHPDTDSDAVRAITALGARVIPLAADVADAAAMQTAFVRLSEEPRLRGIIHAAAEFGAAPIGGADNSLMRGTLRPKIDGTLVLEQLSRGYELDFFVLFSSAATVLGAANYAHYAAANAFLDATAETGRLAGRPVISANWGAWQASAGKERTFREGGLEPMAAETALDALARMLGGGVAPRVIGHFDWRVLKPLLAARASRPMLSHMAVAQVTDHPTPPSEAFDSFADMLKQATAPERQALIAELVRNEVAAVLGLSPDDAAIEPQAGFFDLGMDSLTSVELRRRLEVAVGHSLPSTLAFNYPNLGALIGFLRHTFDEAPAPSEERAAFAASAARHDSPWMQRQPEKEISWEDGTL